MRTNDVQRTQLGDFVPYVIVTTIALVTFPLAMAYRLSAAPFELGLLTTTLICTAISIGLGKVGAALWQRHPRSSDVVFEDLLIWGFARRLINERRVTQHVDRLAKGMSHQEHLESLKKLARSLEVGDPFTHGHSERVARHAFMVARAMKLPRNQREKIRLAAVLHDIGKLRTPRAILTNPGRLTDEEFEIIKRHPDDGADMVAVLNDEELTAIIRYHHERVDGSGYPVRLGGSVIPLGARIISVADTFDAITSTRPYKEARKHREAIDILEREAGVRLDADVVKAFIDYYTGRRGIRLWLSVSAALPRLLENAIGSARQAVANAAVVGTTAVAVVGGAAVLNSPDVARQTMAPVVTESMVVDGLDVVGSSATATGRGPASDDDGRAQRDRERADGSTATETTTAEVSEIPVIGEDPASGSNDAQPAEETHAESARGHDDTPAEGPAAPAPDQPGPAQPTQEPDPAPAPPSDQLPVDQPPNDPAGVVDLVEGLLPTAP